MINLKITMNGGKEFHIKNPIVNDVKEWIKAALMPHGVQLLWFEIIPRNLIQVSQIQEIRELTDEEVEDLKRPKIVEEEEEKETIVPDDQEKIENL